MDVRLPNGTVVRNVPEGTSKAQIQALAIRNGLATAEDFGGSVQATEPTTTQSIYQAVRPYVAPTVEALGSVAGGVIGAPMGPMGMLGGAGLGYGISKEAMEMADVYLGGKKPREGATQVSEPLRNILEGATYEAAGRVVAPMIARGAGKVMDVVSPSVTSAQLKAGEIARESLGKDLPSVLETLKNAKPGQSVEEITASVENPTWQA